MAENDVSDGRDFDDDNDTVLDSTGHGEVEDPIDRVVGYDMAWPGSKTVPIFA